MDASKGHPLEEGQTRRSIRISLPREAWKASDWLMESLEKLSPGITPVTYGYLIGAGVVRFRQRLRVVGSSLGTLGELMQEFDRFESSSELFPLWPRTPEVNRETRDLEISMPDDAWRIIDGVGQLWSELMQELESRRIPVEMFLGYYLLFGLWWFKELLFRLGNPVTAMKRLLLQVLASGEIE